MLRLRVWCVVFFAWLFAFYNIERVFEPVNLASFVYVLAAAISFPVLLLPESIRIRRDWALLLIIPIVVLPKLSLGYPVGGVALPLTVTEVVAVAITVLLALQVRTCLGEYRTSALSAVVDHLVDRSRPFEQGQSDMYREIRRARKCGRPLALLVVKPTDASLQHSLDRVTLEMQQQIARSYVQVQVAEFLSQELADHDIITCRNQHFVALLPEYDQAQATIKVRQILAAASKRIGLELSIGVSVFPEETTFDQLLEQAELAAEQHADPIGPESNSSEVAAGAGDEQVESANGHGDLNADTPAYECVLENGHK